MTPRLLLPVLLGLCAVAVPPAHAAAATWRVAWATPMSDGDTLPGANGTCRFVARTTVAGDAVTVRISNALGNRPLTIGAAAAGLRTSGATLAAGSSRTLTFAGAASVTIPAGSDVTSDASPLTVAVGDEVAVSVYFPATDPPRSRHALALETAYCTTLDGSAGNHAADVSGSAYGSIGPANWWVDNLAVHTTSATGAVVALGDSITDGWCTGVDTHTRWTDVLARRLGGALGVAMEGISSGRVTEDGDGPSALHRLHRDVLTQPGVSTVFVFEGTNDLSTGITADALIAGLQSIVSQARAAGLHVVGATMIPRLNGGTWTPGMEAFRHQVNVTIRGGTLFDTFVDFDQVVSQHGVAPVMDPAMDCGDHIHPSVPGLAAMANAVPLSTLG